MLHPTHYHATALAIVKSLRSQHRSSFSTRTLTQFSFIFLFSDTLNSNLDQFHLRRAGFKSDINSSFPQVKQVTCEHGKLLLT